MDLRWNDKPGDCHVATLLAMTEERLAMTGGRAGNDKGFVATGGNWYYEG